MSYSVKRYDNFRFDLLNENEELIYSGTEDICIVMGEVFCNGSRALQMEILESMLNRLQSLENRVYNREVGLPWVKRTIKSD